MQNIDIFAGTVEASESDLLAAIDQQVETLVDSDPIKVEAAWFDATADMATAAPTASERLRRELAALPAVQLLG